MIIQPAPQPSYAYVSLPRGWDRVWKAAKAAAATAPAVLSVVGDSVAEGFKASDMTANSWAALLEADLASRVGRYGSFVPVSFSNDWNVYGASSVTFAGTSPWTSILTTASRGYAVRGPFRALFYSSGMTGAGSNPVTFVTPYACTAIDLLVQDGTVSGTFGYTVDGGAVQTVNIGSTGYWKRVQITGLANTTHTVVIDSQSGNNVLVLAGIATYTGNAGGLMFANMSYAGASAYASFGPTASPLTVENSLQGRVSAGTATGFGIPFGAHAGIIAIGINDCQNFYGVAAFRRVLQRIVSGYRGGRKNCSLAFVAHDIPSYVTSDATSGFLNAQNWHRYVAVMREMAQQSGAAFVNFQEKWGETAYGDGLIEINDSHPTTAGHADIFATLRQIF